MPDALELIAAFDPLAGQLESARSERTRKYFVVDAFTDAPFQGNQLAVMTDARGLGGEQMQRIARELNLSETVFVLAPEQGGDVRVRIFTPATELPFAGHPVLGCAVLLARALQRGEVTLETGAGPVPVTVAEAQGLSALGRMRQPIPSWEPYAHEPELLAALGVERPGLPLEVYCNGPLHVYVELPSERAVAALEPDIRALTRLGELCVSCFAGSAGRWKTRMFAPGLGVPEDPATGSAAGPLAVHLSRHGRIAFGEEIEIRQGAEVGRPSLLFARADGSPAALERVEVAGAAVIVARGEFLALG
jgi:trans-2,3-dihydro-3-hydroxyanthranilate isomerase